MTVDSMRTYPSDSDDRGKIPFFDEFALNALDFTNCYCSAPSTVMSVSSMMTAVPAVYHSTTYDHFDKNSLGFETFPEWLGSIGFKSQSIVFFPEGREHLTHLMGDTARKFWPQGKNNRFWGNDDIFHVYCAAVDEWDNTSKNFIYVHFNIRHDPETDMWVRRCYKKFKEKFSDTIVILTSDHGYPDPNRGIKNKEMVYHGHDLLMTDDNVRVPFAIEGIANCPKNSQYDDLASLVDIVPTLQRIIKPGLENTLNKNFFDSGIDLIKERRSSLEIYNRYIFQKNQQIKFVTNNRKIIYSEGKLVEEKGEKLFDSILNEDDYLKIEKKIQKIDQHFHLFLKRKLSTLDAKSVLFCSNPLPKMEDIFHKMSEREIFLATRLEQIPKNSKIYLVKTSENIFQTINDYRLLKKSSVTNKNIEVVSLNLDKLAFIDSKFQAIVHLFITKFIPRFLANPRHTLMELWIVIKKI